MYQPLLVRRSVVHLAACAVLSLCVFASASTAGFAATADDSAAASPAGPGPASWAGDLDPIGPEDWSWERAAHLIERAGFGATPEEIDRLASMTPEEAVAYLVDYEKVPDLLPAYQESGIWSAAMARDADRHLDFSAALRAAYLEGGIYGAVPNAEGPRRYQPIVDALYYKYLSSNREWWRVANWWAERMATTPRQLEEKMTLFWHNHFATEEVKVDDYRLMLQQNQTLRRLATSDLRTLLLAMSQDPAMLVYLDNRSNVAGHANENYAREILELFSLGIGNYTEGDIKEAARAFTGLRNQGLQSIDDRSQHDDGEKTIFGKTGTWDGEDAVDLILEQPAAARFVAGKLYRYLVRGELADPLREELAAGFRTSGYELKPLLRRILLSRDFYSPPAWGTQIKEPVQFLVGTYRKLGLESLPGVPGFYAATATLGQALGNPPNVKGWDGGRVWLNPSTLLARGNQLRHLLFPETAGDTYALFDIPERYLDGPEAAAWRDHQEVAGAYEPMAGENAEGASSGSMAGGAAGGSMAADAASPGSMDMTAPSSRMINSRPDYDLKLGVYNGFVGAYENIKPTPPIRAPIDLRLMLVQAGASTVEDAIAHFERRFLRLPLHEADRRVIVGFARDAIGGDELDLARPELERTLREVLHLVLSSPEYQLS